ncbi:hypothetical protein H7F15_18395 [Pontibacter sp. Tf4]|uniref:S41 family peptidase n=1 Tax=Pontibacter sp. Tf4 TaxID=2761620 RepID=UPI001624C30A|nr:S41 family peptidase [Pontibacter sp. Tf4]MBB6613017.1 hypothetical protein [Pontibacter sp. Tf4]
MNRRPFQLPLLLLIIFLLCSFPALASSSFHTKKDGASLAKDSLSERQISNLFAFAKAYGYVKYFYPLKKKDKINWSYIAADGASTVLKAEDDAALQQALQALFTPIAPLMSFSGSTASVTVSGKDIKQTRADLMEDAGKYYYNLHKGLGQDKAELPLLTRNLLGSRYKSSTEEVDRKNYLEMVKAGFLLPIDSLYTGQLTQELYCTFPITLTADAYNSNNAYKYLKRKYELNLSLHQDRLATIVIFWNVFQHFHPYLNQTSDWDAVFVQAMRGLSSSMSEREFVSAARKMIPPLRDGHAVLAYTNKSGIYNNRSTAPAISTGWVENKLVVTKVNVEGADLHPGDIIETINSTDATELVSQLRSQLSFANEQNGNLLAGERLLGSYLASDKTIHLVLSDSLGNKREVQFDGKAYHFKQKTAVPVISEVESGIYYLDASRITEKDIKNNLEVLKQAKGLVFDLRLRPTPAFTSKVLPYFIQNDLQTGNWMTPNYTFPDQKRVQYKKAGGWHIKPNSNYIEAKLAFLIGHSTFSYGETCAEIIDHYNLGTTVGWYTASTNGDMNFAAAGRLQVVWTGLKVLKRDGSPYHGVGIKPAIPVEPKILDVRAGKDTQLNAAVEYLKKM